MPAQSMNTNTANIARRSEPPIRNPVILYLPSAACRACAARALSP
jgi:hypothetical protein